MYSYVLTANKLFVRVGILAGHIWLISAWRKYSAYIKTFYFNKYCQTQCSLSYVSLRTSFFTLQQWITTSQALVINSCDEKVMITSSWVPNLKCVFRGAGRQSTLAPCQIIKACACARSRIMLYAARTVQSRSRSRCGSSCNEVAAAVSLGARLPRGRFLSTDHSRVVPQYGL